ncbi:hypothetical protein [Haloarchaeobius sp. TZWWS8]|uniref:hypothetical protein n=1 Tax=Haloarchaeobius sp. TZWWS8 TaxID=3446121 RepID=UPI003EC0EFC6
MRRGDSSSALDASSTGRPFSRYDLVLLFIPLAFVTAAVAAVAFSIPVHRAVTVGGGCCLVALADALFVNPPGRGEGRANG